jgi:hypothetical protein
MALSISKSFGAEFALDLDTFFGSTVLSLTFFAIIITKLYLYKNNRRMPVLLHSAVDLY